MAKSFIKLYNQNNTPPLTADNIKDMTNAQNTTMTTISKSEALKYTYGCDGVVDLNNVVKGTASAGNVSAVLSIASSKEGQNVISDIINNAKWSSDYKKVTVTVHKGEGHAFSINNIVKFGDGKDDYYITFTNPHASPQLQYTVPLTELEELGIRAFQYI